MLPGLMPSNNYYFGVSSSRQTRPAGEIPGNHPTGKPVFLIVGKPIWHFPALYVKTTRQMKWTQYALILGALLSYGTIYAQGEPIELLNPSFEDFPRHSKPPRDWNDCGFPNESPPDIQPDPAYTFQVSKDPVDGDTYLGMVVRDNETYERVSQRLARPLEKGKCYEFSIYLARSPMYVSLSKTKNETTNYTTPAKLRIWGGFGQCDRNYLLAETKVINHDRWLQYNFTFEPIGNYTYIILEAYYQTPTLFPYNGNILLDHASAITPVPCKNKDKKDEEVGPQTEPVAANTPPKTPDKKPANTNITPKNGTQKQDTPKVNTPPPTPKKELDITNVERADLREGTTIRINNLFFQANKAEITEESFVVLNQLYDFLRSNSDVIVEIGGHTNNQCDDEYCNKLSNDRAKAVADYLASKGIPRDRLRYKGYGKTRPVDLSQTPEGRRKNQRVEVKVLGFKQR